MHRSLGFTLFIAVASTTFAMAQLPPRDGRRVGESLKTAAVGRDSHRSGVAVTLELSCSVVLFIAFCATRPQCLFWTAHLVELLTPASSSTPPIASFERD